MTSTTLSRCDDPVDELAYTFDQNALTLSQRRAFWDRYERSMDGRSRPAHLAERVNWWEPVTLLGSARIDRLETLVSPS